MGPKIWLSSPHMGGTEQDYIKQAFDSNWIAPLGPNVNGFEADLSNYLDEGVSVAALSSGTAALHLGLILLGVGPGDEVICQSMTFAASANPIVYLGAKPVFVDSEPETWNMSPAALEQAVLDRLAKGRKVKAIIPVHLYGMPAKMQEINAIAKAYGIPVLEDAAEALGSSIDGQRCGTFGDLAALSFNGNKIITTSGGGALVAQDRKYATEARFLATQALDDAPHYQHSRIGYNYRMSNICAGIGRGQMEVLNDRVRQRRRVYDWYREQLEGLPGVQFLPEPTGYVSNRWLTAILIDQNQSGCTSEDLRQAFQENNIDSRPLWKPMHLQPVYRDCPFYGDGTSDRLFERGLCLPSGSNLSNQDLLQIKIALEDFVTLMA